MKKLLSAAAIAAALSGCAHTGLKARQAHLDSIKSVSGASVREYGRIVVIERRGGLYITHTNVLVDSKRKKELVWQLFQSAFPKEAGEPPEPGNPNSFGRFGTKALELTVSTIDDYLEAIAKDPAKRKTARREILTELGGNFALVYRYVDTGKNDPEDGRILSLLEKSFKDKPEDAWRKEFDRYVEIAKEAQGPSLGGRREEALKILEDFRLQASSPTYDAAQFVGPDPTRETSPERLAEAVMTLLKDMADIRGALADAPDDKEPAARMKQRFMRDRQDVYLFLDRMAELLKGPG